MQEGFKGLEIYRKKVPWMLPIAPSKAIKWMVGKVLIIVIYTKQVPWMLPIPHSKAIKWMVNMVLSFNHSKKKKRKRKSMVFILTLCLKIFDHIANKLDGLDFFVDG